MKHVFLRSLMMLSLSAFVQAADGAQAAEGGQEDNPCNSPRALAAVEKSLREINENAHSCPDHSCPDHPERPFFTFKEFKTCSYCGLRVLVSGTTGEVLAIEDSLLKKYFSAEYNNNPDAYNLFEQRVKKSLLSANRQQAIVTK